MHRFFTTAGQACLASIFFYSIATGQDSIEFLNGSKLDGKVIEIRKDAKEFEFQATIGNQELTRTYSYSQIHAATFNGKRFILTPKPDDMPAANVPTAPNNLGGKQDANSTSSANDTATEVGRTQAEVQRLIDAAGTTPPDWFDSTPMNHPASLDLDWPMKAEGPWNESKNVGQYIWGRVNPNEGRWRSGIKLVHECMARHVDNPGLLTRDMEKLGEMYFTLLQDYARAAFWFQKANATVSKPTGIHLAECYWRLGNKDLAMSLMKGKLLHFDAIKLLGDMGEIDDALDVTEYYSKTNVFNEAYLNAGDALRNAGRFDEAIAYYQKVLNLDQARNEEYKQRFQGRASAAIEAIQLFDRVDVTQLADGTYTDHSTGYNGKLEVQVTVANARIDSVKVIKHNEKQFYTALTDTTQQIVGKQSVRDIDGTSGATITSQAIIHATARALSQGTK